MPDPTPSQLLMVEDGLPSAALIPASERRETWKNVKPRTPAISPAPEQEITMTKTATAAKKAAPRKTPARKTPAKTARKATSAPPKTPAPKTPAFGERADGLRPGSKQALMIDLAKVEGGATEATLCEELGWKKCRVTLKRTAERIGAELETSKNAAGETVFHVKMPKRKTAA